LPVKDRSVNCLAFDRTGRYFALAGLQITLWNLALVRDQLIPLGLAWDQASAEGGSGVAPPPPAVGSTQSSRPLLPDTRRVGPAMARDPAASTAANAYPKELDKGARAARKAGRTQ
ncbi:MAG: hypothetical protein ACYC61_14565, partial [Isosphaeraceae bacterium]